MLQIALLGLMTIFLSLCVKQVKPEYGVYISIAGCLMIFFSTVTRLSGIVAAFQQLEQYIRVDTLYMNTLLKVVGIAYLSEFSANICRDAGYQALASQIELFSKLQILTLSLPIMFALFETLEELQF